MSPWQLTPHSSLQGVICSQEVFAQLAPDLSGAKRRGQQEQTHGDPYGQQNLGTAPSAYKLTQLQVRCQRTGTTEPHETPVQAGKLTQLKWSRFPVFKTVGKGAD